MTHPPDHPQTETREADRDRYLAHKRATEDLADIRALREHPATDRYLLRRARECRDRAAHRVLNDDTLPAEQREAARQVYQAFADFCGILDSDELAHQATLAGVSEG